MRVNVRKSVDISLAMASVYMVLLNAWRTNHNDHLNHGERNPGMV